MSEIKLIVGLGNPGRDYEGTRHNVGFEILDRWASEKGEDFRTETKWESSIAKLGSVTLQKPLTFMNLSGRAVGALQRFYRWEPSQILAVYDDVSLPLGSLRFRENGSAGGHNGVKSLIEHLGTQDFPRLKIGVGAAGEKNLSGHVLGRFQPDEQEELQNTLATAVRALQLAASGGVSAAANQFNVKSKPKQTHQSQDEQEIRRSDSIEHQGK